MISLERTTFAAFTYTDIPVTFNGANASSYTVLLYQGTAYDPANALNGLVMFYKPNEASGFKAGGGTGISIYNASVANSLPVGTYTIRVWNASSQVVDTKVINLIDSEEVFVFTARELYELWQNPTVPNGGWGFDAQLMNDGNGEYLRLTTNSGAAAGGAVGAGRLFLSMSDGVNHTYSGKPALLGIKYRGYSGGSVGVMCGNAFADWASGIKNTFYTGNSGDWLCSTSWSYEVPQSFGTFSLDFYSGKGAGYTIDIQYVSISYCGGGLDNAVDQVYGW